MAKTQRQVDTNKLHGLADQSDTFGMMVLKRFLKHKLAIIGITILLILVGLTIISGLFGEDINKVHLMQRFKAPSADHWMGTDELGRDVLGRIIAGGKVSLSLGIVVSITSVLIGSTVGAVSGFFGGKVDAILMRIVDFMISMPQLPLLLVMAAIMGPGFMNIAAIMIIFGWMGISRVVRSQVLSLKEQEFILAARAIGVSTPRIIFLHIIPNTLAPIIVNASLACGGAILRESYLSYLGLGIQPPTPSWGNMLMNARQYLTTAPWLAIWPGVFIFFTILAFNFMGDGLRDAFDPKLKGR